MVGETEIFLVIVDNEDDDNDDDDDDDVDGCELKSISLLVLEFVSLSLTIWWWVSWLSNLIFFEAVLHGSSELTPFQRWLSSLRLWFIHKTNTVGTASGLRTGLQFAAEKFLSLDGQKL